MSVMGVRVMYVPGTSICTTIVRVLYLVRQHADVTHLKLATVSSRHLSLVHSELH
jgi:hypothetical protein